jgi:hypothetical protein
MLGDMVVPGFPPDFVLSINTESETLLLLIADEGTVH